MTIYFSSKHQMILQFSKIKMTILFFQHQAQQLLQMICYPNGVPNQVDGSEPDNKQIIQRVLQNLDIWGLRVSLLELQLLFKQATTQQVRNQNQGLRTNWSNWFVWKNVPIFYTCSDWFCFLLGDQCSVGWHSQGNDRLVPSSDRVQQTCGPGFNSTKVIQLHINTTVNINCL